MLRQFHASTVLFLFLIGTAIASAQSFSDTFNRPDGSVDNGWSTWGNGAQILGGQLETFGLANVAGGIVRSLPVTFPLTFSFDFRTDAPTDGGWIIGFNTQNPSLYPGCCLGGNAEFALVQYTGATSLMYQYQTSAGQQSVEVPLVVGQEEYQSSATSHISGTVNADLSSSVTITYPDATQVTILTPAPPAGAIVSPEGPYLSFGNPNATYGPHFFDNLSISSGPLYHLCLLYDPTKAVKSGATIPIKLQLCDSTGNDLSSSSITAHATSITEVSTSVSGQVEASGNANPDSDFRFDSTLGTTGGYIFNLSTKGLRTGTYNLNFTVTGDSFVYAAQFQVE